MKYVLAVAMTAALALTASTAPAAAKDPKRDARHARAPAVVAPEPWRGVNPRIMAPRPNECLQDEGYGRYTVCGQGPP